MKKWISHKKFKQLHYAERVRDLLREHKEDIEVIVVEDQKYALSTHFMDENAYHMYDSFVNGFVCGVVYELSRKELEKQEEKIVETKNEFTEGLKKL